MVPVSIRYSSSLCHIFSLSVSLSLSLSLCLPLYSSLSLCLHREVCFLYCLSSILKGFEKSSWVSGTSVGLCIFLVCSRLLCLPPSASVDLLLPLLFSSRLHLLHAWALLVEALGGGPPPSQVRGPPGGGGGPQTKRGGPYAVLLAKRLRCLAQDQTLNQHERVLCIR